MRKRFFSGGWLALAAAFLCLTACSKPQPNSPTKDFARRHQCPVSSVESTKEAWDRMRVSGCGESELYVQSCSNRGGALPANESRQPLSESEARLGLSARPTNAEQGCAWARQQPSLVSPAGSTPQPKWLSTP